LICLCDPCKCDFIQPSTVLVLQYALTGTLYCTKNNALITFLYCSKNDLLITLGIDAVAEILKLEINFVCTCI